MIAHLPRRRRFASACLLALLALALPPAPPAGLLRDRGEDAIAPYCAGPGGRANALGQVEPTTPAARDDRDGLDLYATVTTACFSTTSPPTER